MDLDTLVKETVKRVVEGGKALGGERIAREDIEPTLRSFDDLFLRPFGIENYHLLGSTGKKTDSGDIDLAIETKFSLEDIAAFARKHGYEARVFKGLDQVSVLFPQSVPGKRVQIDLIKGDPEYLKWSHPSPADSKYKGFYTRAIANAIIKVTTGKHVNVTRGVFTVDPTNKQVYTIDLRELAQAIGHGWTPEDLTMSLEKIWDKAKRTFTPEQLDGIREYVREFMKNKKAPFPDELNEAITPQSAAHRFERLKDVIIANCPSITKVAEAPPGSFTGTGLAVYSPGQRAIIVKSEAPEPYKSYAAAHEAGHVKDLADAAKFKRTQELVKKFRSAGLSKDEADEYLEMEQRAWKIAEWFLQKAGIPVDKRFEQRRDKSMKINAQNVRKATLEDVVHETVAKIARGIVPAYGNLRHSAVVGHPKGAQVGQGNIGGARNRGTPGYPVPPEMTAQRGQEGEVDGGGIEVLEAEEKKQHTGTCIMLNIPYKASRKLAEVKPDGEDPADMHITMFYAKGLTKKQQEKVGEIWKRVWDDHGPIECETQHLGVFPASESSDWKPVLHATVENDLLTACHDDLVKSLAQDGIESNSEHEWKPHITLKYLDDDESCPRSMNGVVFELSEYTFNEGTATDELNEVKKPGDLEWGIRHLDDLTPAAFMEFLKKYADEPLRLEISEKVDGSARLSFGVGGGTVWTQTKTGTRKAMSSQYPDTAMFKPVKEAHKALESKKEEIVSAWPDGIQFMVAEVLYGKIPNAIEYGDNRLIIHGVQGAGGEMGEVEARNLAMSIVKATGGQAGEFKIEYKRTINPKDVMVDIRKEYDTLGQLYSDLAKKPNDKEAKLQFQKTQKAVKEKLVKMLRTQHSAYGPEGGDIEGLVFRDLDSGTLVKLVDRDYFKTLVDFMWSWRNRVNKEVMVGFREVVARDALGDAGAAGNRLVSSILASGKVDARVKPEEAADKLIASYIQKNKLMKPDFYVSFQRALMGAFQDLERIKLQWERVKDEKQSTTIQGKTREMGPDVKERTTEAIRDAEAALKGIRAGMEVAEGIKDPLTQKVALFKLFMGHRFQRLVDKVGENLTEGVFDPHDDTEERANQLYPSSGPVGKTSQSKAEARLAHRDVIMAIEDKLARRVGKRVNPARDFIAAGASASAFDLHNGRVFKLTTDSSDAAASFYFMKHPAKHVVKVFDVFELPQNLDYSYSRYYGIVVEKLEELDRDEVLHVQQVSWLMGGIQGQTWEQVYARLSAGDQDDKNALEILQAYGLDEMIDEFAQAHFSTEDFHSGNVMKRRDGTLVMSDLGISTSKGEQVPKLEKKIYEAGPIDRMTGATDLSGAPRVDDVGLDDAQQANEAASNWLKGITAAAMMGLTSPMAADEPPEPSIATAEEPSEVEPEPAPSKPPTIDQIVKQASDETGVDQHLIKAMMSIESGGDPNAVSPKGAKGLMQLMPGTAKAYGATDPYDPEQNIKAAARYIAKLKKAFHNRLDWVLAAYNMGPNALHKSKGPEYYPKETKDYIKRVRAALKKLKAQPKAPRTLDKAVHEAINRLLIEAGMIPSPTEVLSTNEFNEWYHSLDEEQQAVVQRLLNMLRQFGVNLREPYSDSLAPASKHKLRELRHATGKHPLRVSYGFTPDRRALVLIGASKKGKGDNRKFTQDFASTSDKLWARYNNLKEAKLWEADQPEFVGAVIGRFQPFHAGHAAMIRKLAQRFTRVIVFVAGLTPDKNNPFDFELRLEMMEKSLPDVWSKIEVYPASVQGKGTGYLPGLLANVVQAGKLDPHQAVVGVVGEDRVDAVRKQVAHGRANVGKPGYYTGTIEVEVVPGFKNEDDVDRVSGTRIRQAIAKGDRNEVKRMLDPHLVSDPTFLEDLLVRMEAGLKTPGPQATLEAIVEKVMNELGMGGLETGVGWTRGGAWGSSGWSRAVLARGEDGDEIYQQMLRSPSTRMLPMANPGTPNSDLPGVNRIDGEHEDDTLAEPTDLDEVIDETIRRFVGKSSNVK